MRFLSLSLAILLICGSARAEGQAVQRPRFSDKVRITTGDISPYVGQVLFANADSIVIDRIGKSPLSIPVAPIEKLEVSAGRTSRTLLGGALGLGFGAVAGALIGGSGWGTSTSEKCPSTGNFDLCGITFCDRSCSAGIGALVMGGAGLLAGLVVGSSISTEQWIEIPIPRR